MESEMVARNYGKKKPGKKPAAKKSTRGSTVKKTTLQDKGRGLSGIARAVPSVIKSETSPTSTPANSEKISASFSALEARLIKMIGGSKKFPTILKSLNKTREMALSSL